MRTLLSLLLFTLSLSALGESDAAFLRALYAYMAPDDRSELPSGAAERLARVDTSDIAAWGDSLQYMYHYFWGYGEWAPTRDDTLSRLAHLERAAALRERSLGVHDAEYFDLMNAIAVVYTDLHQPQRAIRLMERALVRCDAWLAEAAGPMAQWVKATAYCQMGMCYTAQGDQRLNAAYYLHAATFYRRAFTLLRDAFTPEEGSVEPLLLLAAMLRDKGFDGEAITVFTEALDYMSQRGMTEGEYVALALRGCAAAQLDAGRAAEAEASLRRYIHISADSDEEPFLTHVYLLQALADQGKEAAVDSLLRAVEPVRDDLASYYYIAALRYKAAAREEAYRDILRRMRKWDERERYDYLAALGDLVVANKSLGREAYVAMLEDHADLAERVAGGRRTDGYVAYEGLVALYAHFAGDTLRTRLHGETALTLYREAALADTALLFSVAATLSHVYLQTGRHAALLALLQPILPLAAAHSERRAALLQTMAEAETCLTRYDDALTHYAQALDILRTLYGDHHIAYAALLAAKGHAHLLRGDKGEAADCLHRAAAIEVEREGAIRPQTQQDLEAM